MNWAFVLFLVVFLFDIILAFSNLKNEKWLFYEHIFRALMFGWLALATWTQMETFYLLAIVSFVITVAIQLQRKIENKKGEVSLPLKFFSNTIHNELDHDINIFFIIPVFVRK
jgi:hypothetical protein